MFVTKNQAFVFFACVAFGGVAGVLFGVSDTVKKAIKNRALKILSDILAFALFSALFSAFGFIMRFPSFRPYMAAWSIAGAILYMKSFHLTLAKITKKLYNITVSKVRDRILKRRDKKDDERRFCGKSRNRGKRRRIEE